MISGALLIITSVPNKFVEIFHNLKQVETSVSDTQTQYVKLFYYQSYLI